MKHDPVLPEFDRSLARLVRRANLAVALDALARVAAPALFALGAWVLVARFALSLSRAAAAWSLCALSVAPIVAWLIARKRFFTRADAAAWLDRASGGSGALLVQFELADERWTEAAQRALASIERLPRFEVGRAFGPSALALAFLAGAFALDRSVLPAPPATRVVEARIDATRADLTALGEIVELEPERARELEARLARLAEQADGAPLDASLEAVDRTRDELARRAEDALAAAERASGGLDAAVDAADAATARRELENALRELADAGLAAKLPPEVLAKLAPDSLELPAGVELSAAELAKLSDAVRSALDLRLDRLAKSGLLSRAKLERFRELQRVFEHVCDETCKRGGT